MASQKTIKKTLLIEPDKLKKLQKHFKTKSEAEAVRCAIDETLAYQDVLQAARRIQKRGTFARS